MLQLWWTSITHFNIHFVFNPVLMHLSATWTAGFTGTNWASPQLPGCHCCLLLWKSKLLPLPSPHLEMRVHEPSAADRAHLFPSPSLCVCVLRSRTELSSKLVVWWLSHQHRGQRRKSPWAQLNKARHALIYSFICSLFCAVLIRVVLWDVRGHPGVYISWFLIFYFPTINSLWVWLLQMLATWNAEKDPEHPNIFAKMQPLCEAPTSYFGPILSFSILNCNSCNLYW